MDWWQSIMEWRFNGKIITTLIRCLINISGNENPHVSSIT